MSKRREKQEFVYIIPGPRNYLTLKVLRSANAWWMDGEKLFRLLNAFDNYGASISEACALADVTIRQYKYFANLHPLIYERRTYMRNTVSLRAKIERAKRIQNGDKKVSKKYLAEKYPLEYSLRRHRSALNDLRRRHRMPSVELETVSKEDRGQIQASINEMREMVGTKTKSGHQ